MRIVCPSCTAAYEVPDARIVPGQVVRCARCSADWTPLAEAAAPPGPEAFAAPEPAAFAPPEPAAFAPKEPVGSEPSERTPLPSLFAPPPDRPAVARASGPPVLVGWVLSFAVLGGLGWAAVSWRGDIVRIWPPSERAYAALGLTIGR